ncbi:hypothetical protein vB_RpoS-V16_03 [Ruegeria phage vB_RpoS-V16]|uniref:hypothetical protein n=1 Tax=Ruegeria phage vB_RpoS-V16 TaxID=2218618 RepID=UPI000DCAD908|nr:hypothetical protein JT311_gp03 [Ruegeria phage vB_RpoS-V16]AWY09439.1 hypothetical protein vB_RpoS-V16_03 [Ruegeria phage vB_RpoS-V16]
MFYQMEIQESVNEAIEFYDSSMTAQLRRLRRLRRLALSDLNNGPVYLDSDGYECSCFDTGAKRFNFVSACKTLSDFADEISDISIETEYCEETEESVYETIDGTREQIVKSLFGPLAEYL